jgi:hypothetical protein
MGQRWNSDDDWLQFRSARFYDNRLKEVPNRLLERWITSRRKHGALTLDDLIEIAQLPDTQLDAESMAAGACPYHGLTEWGLSCDSALRPHLRYLATLTPEQRLEAQSPLGLPLTRMSLSQQHAFVTHSLGWRDAGLVSLDDLAGATLRIEYALPGGYQWRVPRAEWTQEWLQWIVPVEPGPQGRRALRPQVRERTLEAALAAARRLDPQAEATQIVPTVLNLTILYVPGRSNKLYVRVVRRDGNLTFSTW